MARPNQLSDDQIRVTVRLPRALYDELAGISRHYRHTQGGPLSALVRKAIIHFLSCPELQQAEAAARAEAEAQSTRIDQAMAAWMREQDAEDAAREARRQAKLQWPASR